MARRRLIRPIAAALGLIAVLGLSAACGVDESSKGDSDLTLVGYSVAREVYSDLIPAFNATSVGKEATFKQSYGASGEQSRAVADGLDADIVAFSFEPDITRLVDAGLVDTDWNAGPEKGMVSDSVVVLIVRAGNPEGITGWDDLTRDGLEVITPNPFTSGAAQWNILGAYGAMSDVGKDEAAGLAYIDALFENVPVQPTSGREALQVFAAGKGDVLLSYENEALAAQAAGSDLEFIVPDDTLLIENPVAVVNTTERRAEADGFVDFLHSATGQRIFGEHGYRPVDPKVAAEFGFAEVPGLFTIAQLGGWPTLRTEYFDPDDGKITKILEGQGVAAG